jgi:hypothetical protein
MRGANVVKLGTAIALMAIITTAANAEEAIPVGRYQIVVVPSGGENSIQPAPVPLLLDTATGRVWAADADKVKTGDLMSWSRLDRGGYPGHRQAVSPRLGRPARPSAAIAVACQGASLGDGRGFLCGRRRDRQ